MTSVRLRLVSDLGLHGAVWVPKASTSSSRLGLLTSISKQETCPKANLMEAMSQRRLPLPRCLYLVSS